MIYNLLLEKVIMPFGDFLNGSNVIQSLKKWRKYSTMSNKEIENISKKKLDNLLKYASLNIPYYENKYIHKENIYDLLKDFPIIEKKEINSFPEKFINKKKKKYYKSHGSGSSGINTTIYVDKNEIDETRAIQLYWMELAGYRFGQPIIQTGMTFNRGFLKRVKDIILRTTYVSAFPMNKDDVKKALSKNSKFKNVLLGGYASSLYNIAKFQNENNFNCANISGSISWGDKLFPKYRKEVKNAFDCDIIDTYGAGGEKVMIAVRSDLEYYYIMSPHVYVEILDENGNNVPDGEIGYIVITKLDGKIMPLIRYKIGDIGIMLPKNKYPEKYNLPFPILQMIIGRDTDIVKTKHGQSLIVHVFTAIFEHYRGIKQFKVIQKNLNGIEIEYIKSDFFKEKDLIKIQDEIIKPLKEDFYINWKEVNEILPTKSGKPQIIQSFLK